MIVVQYLPDRDCVTISGVPTPFPAGSLELRRMGDLFAVAAPHQDTLICAWAPFTAWTRPDGSGFVGANDANAYLTAAVTTRAVSAADISAVPIVCSYNLPAGMPVAVGRADGQLYAARADTKPLAFVAGILPEPVACGFAIAPMRGAVTLPDWTAASGSPSLFPGQPYFLAPTGGITSTPDMTPGLCLARIGVALSPAVLVVRPSDPIQL